MKILLVKPTEFRKGFLDAFFLFSPLQLESVAGSLERHHDVQILDLRLHDDPDNAMISTLNAFQPDIVGVTALTSCAHSAFQALQQAKLFNERITTIVGGQHVSLTPHAFESPVIDIIVIGEGERALREITETLETDGMSSLAEIAGIAYRDGDSFVYTESRILTEELDELPVPARRLTEKNQDQYTLLNRRRWLFIESARGCPYRCEFCSVWRLHEGRCRFKSPERTVAEIRDFSERAETVFFADDNAFVDVDRALRIAQLLAKEKFKLKYYIQARSDTIVNNSWLIDAWKDVGLEGVYLGFEESNAEGMKTIGATKTAGFNAAAVNILRERSVFALGSFIISPSYGRQDFVRLKEHLDELKASMLTFYVLTPYPGTILHEKTKNTQTSKDYRLFDGIHTILPTKLPREEFYDEFASLFEHFWRRRDKEYLLWKMPLGPSLHWLKCLKNLERDHFKLEESFTGVPWAQNSVK